MFHPWNTEFTVNEVKGATLKLVNKNANLIAMSNSDIFVYEPFKFELEGKVFIGTGKLSKNNGFQFWICLIGAKDEIEHFCFSMELEGHLLGYACPENAANFRYTGPICSIDHTIFGLASRGIGINFEMFRNQFMDVNGETRFSLKIRNLKAEVKDENVESGVSDNEVSDDEDIKGKEDANLQITVVNDHFVGDKEAKKEPISSVVGGWEPIEKSNPWRLGERKVHEDKRKENDASEVPDYLQPDESGEPKAKLIKYWPSGQSLIEKSD